MGRKLLRKGGGTREGGKVRSVFQDTMITNGLWEKDGMEMGKMESVCMCVEGHSYESFRLPQS